MTVDSDSKTDSKTDSDSSADSSSGVDSRSDSSYAGPPPELAVGSARPVILATMLAVISLAIAALAYVALGLGGGPELVVDAPADGGRTLARKIEVRGHVVGEAPALTVNGRDVPLTSSEGRWTFAHAVPLEPGINLLLFEATDGDSETQLLRKVESLNALLLDLHPSETGTVTSSSSIAVRGRLIPAMPGQVRLFGVDQTAPLDDEGRFALPAQPLKEGVNTLQLAVEPKGEDTLRKELRAVLDTTPPALSWSWPRDDAAVLENQIKIEGAVEDAHLKKVTLNGQAITTESGTFKSTVPLPSLGTHTLTLVAVDSLGHETRLTRRVRRVERLPVEAPQLSQRWKKVRREAEASLVLIVVELKAKSADGTIVPYRFLGTGFFVSRLGHVLAPKRLIQPWKYRDFATRLAAEQLSVIDDSTHIHAWTQGAQVRRPDGRLNLRSAFSTTRSTVQRLRFDPDAWEGYTPPGATSRLLMVHKENQIDGLALIRLATRSRRLAFLRSDMNLRPGEEVLIVGFPPGDPPATARLTHTLGKVGGVQRQITLDAEPLGGFLGGPVLNRWGRVVGVAEHLRQGRTLRHVSLHVGAARRILYGTGYGRDRPRVPW